MVKSSEGSIGVAGMAEQAELDAGAVLVIDTAGGACQAGVFVDGHPVAKLRDDMTHGHAEALLPMVRAAAERAGVGFGTLRAVVVTAGPGSFTGLRVGLAAAQGLGLGANCPVIAVSSFIAWAFDAGRAVRVALDTRRGDAFVQSFDGLGVARDEPAIRPVAEALAAEAGMDIVGDLAGGVAPSLDAVFRAAGVAAHRRPPVPIYLRGADAVPQGGAGCA